MDKEPVRNLAQQGLHTLDRSGAALRGGSRNVGDDERLVSLIGGGAVLFGGWRRGGLRGLLLTALGGFLVYRGATGYCHINRRLGRSTASVDDRGLLRSRNVRTSASITIGRDPETLYAFWRDVANLPKVVSFITDVTPIDDRRSRWVTQLPYGGRVEWDAEITDDRPNEAIGWRSRADHPLRYEGMTAFRPAPGGRGTEVVLDVSFRPPGGGFGAGLSRSATPLLKRKLREDLRHFKQLMEAGEMPTAQPAPGQASMADARHSVP